VGDSTSIVKDYEFVGLGLRPISKGIMVDVLALLAHLISSTKACIVLGAHVSDTV